MVFIFCALYIIESAIHLNQNSQNESIPYKHKSIIKLVHTYQHLKKLGFEYVSYKQKVVHRISLNNPNTNR